MRHKFRRQHPIGHYIVDFACTEHRLVIEVDGSQHFQNFSDARRTAWLENEGWIVKRFWNTDVLTNTNGVVETILRVLKANGTLSVRESEMRTFNDVYPPSEADLSAAFSAHAAG
jgi:very-short-patch-repair endonuclease